MDLGYQFDVVVHNLLIGGVIDLGHQDEVIMVHVLVCMVTY